jgi:hypothetical protein
LPLLLDFLRSPDGAKGMALLTSRALNTPLRFYIFPGSEPRVQEAVAALIEQYGGVSCEAPAADRTIFLLGSTEVWRQLPPSKRVYGAEGLVPMASE